MKRYNKKIIMITILSCSLVLFGCKNIRLNTYNDANSGKTKGQETSEALTADEKKASDNEKNNKANENVTKENEEIIGKADAPTTVVIQPAANVELVVYTVNSDAEVEAVTAMVPKNSEITPQLIVETVKEAMAENSLMIGIESVTTEDTSVIVSFFADQPPLSNVGAGYETAILDAIAQSLVENLDDFNKVIYRVEGEAYNSGHIELGIDEVYLVD